MAREIKENDKILKEQVIPNEVNQAEVRAGSGSGSGKSLLKPFMYT